MILLGTVAVVPWLDTPWGALALGLLTFAWFRLRPARRERWLVGVPLVCAAAVLTLGLAMPLIEAEPQERLASHARNGWAALWRNLEGTAEEALGRLPSELTTAEDRLQAFNALHRVAVDTSPATTLILLDPNDEAIAWAGPGLLHDLEVETLGAEGRGFRAGFASVSLLVIRPVELSPGAWRLIVGRSHRGDQLPFLLPLRRAPPELDWSVSSSTEAPPGTFSIQLDEETPVLRIRSPAAPEFGFVRLEDSIGPRIAWALVGLALLAFGVSRAVRSSVSGVDLPPVLLAFVGGGGAMSWGFALGLDGESAVALGGGIGIAVGGLLVPWRRRRLLVHSAIGAGFAALLAVVLPRVLMLDRPLVDLSGALAAPLPVVAGRLALFGLALGLLAALRGRTRSATGSIWVVGGLFLLVVAAATHDYWAIALPLMILGGVLTATWTAFDGRRQSPSALILLVLCAALIAGTGWEIGHRVLLKRHLSTFSLPRMGPPSQEEIVEISAQLGEFFAGASVEDLTPGSPHELSSRDVAYALWRRSPLARRDALSALVVTPAEMPTSSFSFGLPPIHDGLADWSPDQWSRLGIPGWQGGLIQGESVLRLGSGPWATVRYWFLPRPGFRLGTQETQDLVVDLLRGDPTSRAPAAEALDPARFALYDSSGLPVIVPWTETPVLFLDEGETPGRITPTPRGRAWTFGRWASDGIEVIYLDLLGAVSAMERVGNQVVSVVAVLTVLMFIALLLALPRAAVRSLLGRTLRSYSKRLLIVYTGLLLVPLLLLNIVLLGQFERRLERQHEIVGEAGLDTAQGILGEYLLALAPGFGVDTALDDELMSWVSRVAGHQVNLYWRGSVRASSRYALFTAGVLPNRIPGEVYSRLSLLGYRSLSRVNSVGDTAYLEMYAPLRIPGAPAQQRLILSLPLLAQQEEAAADVARLRNAAMLVTSILFGLLIFVGNRLAHRFTRPLQQLVEGTQRIADGARSLDLAPSDLELSALVEAVDTMAERIADGRTKLEREKQLVDQMMQNIASGVVSLDKNGVVLMHNPIAAQLLGARVGERIQETLAGNEELKGVEEFVRRVEPGDFATSTVRLVGPENSEKEWSVVWAPLPDESDPAALLVVEDMTVVLRGERLVAWAEMARTIAHEVKNPLTPIRLSTEHMQEVWTRDRDQFEPVFESCTTSILRQVEVLREIAAQFSTYSHVPEFEPHAEDLVAYLRTIYEDYASAATRGIDVGFDSDRESLELRFDPLLLRRAVGNLMGNAVRVTPKSGSVVLSLVTEPTSVRIAVADTGPGVRPEDLSRIFDPYFTTGAGGTGLGLPIARRVVEHHGGTIEAANREGGGLEVVIRLPLGARAGDRPPVDDGE